MNNRGPLLTLSAVVVLAMVLFGVNMASTGDTVTQGQPGYGTTTATPTAGASVTIAPGRPASPAASGPATGPDQPAPAPAVQGTYAGRTAGNEATVAIAAKGGRAVGYLCDGKRVEAWLRGTVTGRRLVLQGRGGSLTGTLQGGAVFGTIELGGRSWPYSAQPAERPAGLYRADAAVRGVQRRIGWIVLQDGRQVGVESDGTTTSAAPPLNPDRRETSVDGVRVRAESVDGDEQFGS
jgi:hypothetical protein